MTTYQKVTAWIYAAFWLLAIYAFHESSSAAPEQSQSYGKPAHVIKKAIKK